MPHPLLLSVSALDLAGVLFLGAALAAAVRVAAGWEPGSRAEAQLRLERAAEAVSLRARACLALLVLSTLVLVFGVTVVLPGLVPGAMCAEGVFQAAGGAGRRAIFLRGAAVALLCLWHLLDRLNRTRPEAPLTVASARALMIAGPVFLLAVLDTFRAFFRIDTQEPVSCCARVYDSFGSLSEAVSTAGIPDAFWLWALAGVTPVLLALGFFVAAFPSGTRARVYAHGSIPL